MSLCIFRIHLILVCKHHFGFYLQTPSSSDLLEAICSTVLVMFCNKNLLLSLQNNFLNYTSTISASLSRSGYLVKKMRCATDFKQTTVFIWIQFNHNIPTSKYSIKHLQYIEVLKRIYLKYLHRQQSKRTEFRVLHTGQTNMVRL